MTQRIYIYTLGDPAFIKREMVKIVDILNKTPGRTIEYYEVEKIRPVRPVTLIDGERHRRIAWDWFKDRFQPDPVFNIVVFHFPTRYKKLWKLEKSINGSYLRDADTSLEFWLTADDGVMAKGYELSDFQRIFLHEMAHGDSYQTGVPEEWTPRDYVHYYDYTLKGIDKIPLSYVRYNIQTKIVDKLQTIIKLYAQFKNH
jgi:hypothetical protein